MKLSLPRHVPIRKLLPFLGAMLVIQLLEGTKLITGLEYLAFVVIMTGAFNAVGGMSYPSGAYLAFFGVLSVGMGGLVKVSLGESLDSNLIYAQQSLLVYVVAACSMWTAAQISGRIRRKRPWLIKLRLDYRGQQIALGSALVGQFGGLLVPFAIISTFNQLNNFLPLSILVAVYTRTKETNGWRSFSILAFLIWLYVTVTWGIFAFSKQGMYTPSAVWVIAALLAGYHASGKKLVLVLAASALAVTFLTPVSQVGRNYRFQANATEVALDLLTHPIETRNTYIETQELVNLQRASYHWFDKPQGLLDRLTMFPVDDALIHLTDQGATQGVTPIAQYAVNMIPRYLMPGEKPVLRWGNIYAHELGMLGQNDTTTGISFSPVGDAYHCLKWWGVTVVIFPILLVMFTFCDSITGSTEQTFWSAIYVILFTHAASEGMLNTPFAAVSTYAFSVVVTAIIAKYFLPYIGGFFIPAPKVIAAEEEDQFSRKPAAGSAVSPFPRTIESKI